MRLLKEFPKSHFKRVSIYFLTCLLFSSMSISVAQAGPKGKGAMGANPHTNLHGRGTFTLVDGRVNPAGVIIGSGGLRVNGAAANYGNVSAPAKGVVNPAGVITGGGGTRSSGIGASYGGNVSAQSTALIGNKASNIATITVPNGYFVMPAGENVFLGQPGSNIVVKLHLQHPHIPGDVATVKVLGGKKFALAAGDIFSQAILDIAPLSSTGDTAGTSGKARGHQWQGVDFNPGGGPKDGQDGIGDKGWGTGNKGNGVGNTWVGNQGRGVGGGMAGGSKPDNGGGGEDPGGGGEDPGGGGEDPGGGDNGNNFFSEAAPLPQMVISGVEEEEFQVGGCPALLAWVAEELGLEQDNIQVYLENTLASVTDIQPCDMCARLKDAAAVLADPNRAAALAWVVGQFVATPAPPSEEQMAVIATALAQHRDDDETYYAAAGQWLDALVEYIGILDAEMGWSVDEAVALVADKYVAPVTEDTDINLIAFVNMLLEATDGYQGRSDSLQGGSILPLAPESPGQGALSRPAGGGQPSPIPSLEGTSKEALSVAGVLPDEFSSKKDLLIYLVVCSLLVFLIYVLSRPLRKLR